jgi:2-polyprenyl-3-methyl-5-hydroxy-6-metoxy-1,4-benzoquinol methylase
MKRMVVVGPACPEAFPSYLMEDENEAYRLEQKTDFESLKQQAVWAGLTPGMRVLDLGCGCGVTSSMLKQLVGPCGEVVGMDISSQRIAHAEANYGQSWLSFVCKDVYSQLDSLGSFDFIWARFFLEYHAQKAPDIVEGLRSLLVPGGILCLADLDNNCRIHYQLPDRLESSLQDILGILAQDHDFDPYIGRKLYAYMFDADYTDISVQVHAHHLIYGQLSEKDAYNWSRKLEVAVRSCRYDFPCYPGGFDEFKKEFIHFFTDPRRFTYTPLVLCRGRTQEATS